MSDEVAVFDAKYPENWIVMQNRITQAFREMSIDEKRIIILASPLVRLNEASEKTPIEIIASEFAELSEIDIHSAYKQMKTASSKLMKRTFIYKDEDGDTEVQWVIRSKYANGYISMYFTDEVIHLLKVFDSLNPYTKYLKEDILSLRLSYSIDLYHLAKKYEAMGGFTMTLDDYRRELGTPKSYERINNLKDNAVDAPIKEINENEKTDITLSYENVKRGRTVTGLKFTVRAKPKPKNENKNKPAPDSDKPLKPLKGKQLAMFAKKLSEDHVFGSEYGGNCKSYGELAVRLMNELQEADKVNEYREHLLRVGFNPL